MLALQPAMTGAALCPRPVLAVCGRGSVGVLRNRVASTRVDHGDRPLATEMPVKGPTDMTTKLIRTGIAAIALMAMLFAAQAADLPQPYSPP
jgi:hypothetical protein